MNLIDAHAHLMDEKFDGEVEKIINNAQEAGVIKIINIAPILWDFFLLRNRI